MIKRELLGLAAKAAGIPVEWVETHSRYWIELGHGLEVRPWEPDIDDGDSRRLEVALQLTVDRRVAADGRVLIRVGWGSPLVSHLADRVVEVGEDMAEANRRVILEAAARLPRRRNGQIGRAGEVGAPGSKRVELRAVDPNDPRSALSEETRKKVAAFLATKS